MIIIFLIAASLLTPLRLVAAWAFLSDMEQSLHSSAWLTAKYKLIIVQGWSEVVSFPTLLISTHPSSMTSKLADQILLISERWWQKSLPYLFIQLDKTLPQWALVCLCLLVLYLLICFIAGSFTKGGIAAQLTWRIKSPEDYTNSSSWVITTKMIMQ